MKSKKTIIGWMIYFVIVSIIMTMMWNRGVFKEVSFVNIDYWLPKSTPIRIEKIEKFSCDYFAQNSMKFRLMEFDSLYVDLQNFDNRRDWHLVYKGFLNNASYYLKKDVDIPVNKPFYNFKRREPVLRKEENWLLFKVFYPPDWAILAFVGFIFVIFIPLVGLLEKYS